MPSVAKLINHLPFASTSSQEEALGGIEDFLSDPSQDFFILRGAAGTGKTSLTKAISQFLFDDQRRFELVAPTGRAARIIRRKTKFRARTIHNLIYTVEQLEGRPGVRMNRRLNKAEDPLVIIVDEASMISDTSSNSKNFITPGPLLTDLIDYSLRGPSGSKMIFIGDPCQLPPVNDEFSSALDEHYLRDSFGLDGQSCELKEVMRQSADSPVLDMAQVLRNGIESGIMLSMGMIKDRLVKEDPLVEQYFAGRDISDDRAVLLAWRNLDVNKLNNTVRQRLGFGDTVLMPGDQILTQRPYYNGGRFLAGGETGRVLETGSVEHVAGLDFLQARLQFTESDDTFREIDTLVNLNVLCSERGLLNQEQEKTLYASAMRNNKAYRESQKESDDAYLGAIRIRYGYAMTVHKAQGSEWDFVFLHPYMPNNFRWLYTAVTRARVRVATEY